MKAHSLFKASLALSSAVLAILAGRASATPTLNVIKDLCYAGTTCSGGGAQGQGMVGDGTGDFYGLTADGGVYGHGQIFKLKKSGSTYSYVPIYDFCASGTCIDGSAPVGKLIVDTNGALYGVTAFGGSCTPIAAGCGTIFKLTPTGVGTTYALATLHTFCNSGSTCPNGTTPGAGLTYDGDPGSLYTGLSPLYGTVSNGGANAHGAVFKLNPATSPAAYSVIYSFCPSSGCADGEEPNSVIADGSGTLYGTTPLGGADGDGDGTTNGVVFQLSPSGGGYAETTLWQFCATGGCTDGKMPNGKMMINGNGKLLGETVFGGANGSGTIFRVNPANSTESIRYDFCATGGLACTDGANPRGGLVANPSGDLYGTTAFGGNRFAPGGTVFKWDGTNLTTQYKFCPSSPTCADGNLVQNGVALDASGNSYGATTGGGANGGGVVFQLIP